MKPTNELLPCPFCGENFELSEIRGLSPETWKVFHPQRSICPLNNQIVFSHVQKERAIEYMNLRYTRSNAEKENKHGK